MPEPPFKQSCRSLACNFIKREALAQVFSCEFCEICKNTFFTEHLRWLLLNETYKQLVHEIISCLPKDDFLSAGRLWL